MKTLGIITARGGSKSIPSKNLSDLAGKSLLARTAEAALSAELLTSVVISTDCEQIANAAMASGVRCPFMRPEELARDETPTLPVLVDVVEKLEASGEHYDAVFTLQPTNPLRLSSDIDGAIELLAKENFDSVISFSYVGERHPARMKTIDADGCVQDPVFAEAFEGQRRQDLAPYFLRDGSVYLTRRETLVDQRSIKGDRCRAWLIPAQRACNIDEPFDLQLAEFLWSLGPENFPGRPA